MTTEAYSQQAVLQAIEQALVQAVAEHKAGQLELAAKLYQAILQLDPGHPEANHNLGALAVQMKQPANGLAYFMAALEADPARRQYWLSYIDAHMQAGQMEAAREVLAQARKQGLKGAEVDTLAQRLEPVIPVHSIKNLSRHHGKNPGAQEINSLVKLFNQGSYAEAEVQARLMTERFPVHGFGWKVLGAVYKQTGRNSDAVLPMQKAADFFPNDVEAHYNLGVALHELGRLEEAEVCYRNAIRINPKYADALSNLGKIAHDLGRLDEAESYWRKALDITPGYALVNSNLLFCLSQNAKTDAQTLFAEHCRFGERFEKAARKIQFNNSRDGDRVLRIGFVSADFRNHAVAAFIEPVLSHLSGSRQVSLFAYYNHTIRDSTTLRMRGYFAEWREVVDLPDAALADRIRADNIDILIDLSGHANDNRLSVFALKVAPVQVSWMGYPGTTGLKNMDYYVADRFFLPPGEFEDQFTEKIVRLPANAPFLPAEESPPVNALPALASGHVTFGSFNRVSKLSPAVVDLWARLLHAVPDSRMLLGSMPEDGNHEMLAGWFKNGGVARERLDFHPRSDLGSYLALHQQVDICLDTFPYNGGTTTLHAIWMGVPTLTLTGGTAAGRTGASILGHVGLEGFIARDEAEFLRKGLAAAGDLAALSDIRKGLRVRFAASALGKPELVARGLEQALRIMWLRWCVGLPAESFETNGK